MTFIISLKTKYGFVMGADSRMTVSYDDGTPDWITDNYQKVFLTTNNIGILVCGTLNDKSGEPIMKVLPKFLENYNQSPLDIDLLSEEIHRLTISNLPNTTFLVSGYKENMQYTYAIQSQKGIQDKTDFSSYFFGDIDIADNLLNKSDYKIPIEHFTLEDGKEFINHLFDVTQKTMRFQSRKQTVGGNFSRLIITPSDSYFC